MAAHVVVIDTSFRREKVKVGPTTFISDILEEACTKWNLSSSEYILKNAKKTIDLSCRFRESGLISGAKLELIAASRSPSIIQVALDLPDSEAFKALQKRHVRSFASDTTFWRILREYETSIGGNLNFTARGVAHTNVEATPHTGKIYYETPVLNVMGRELSSFTDLQKNLAQLGFRNGSVSIKLMFRVTDRLLEQAMTEIGAYFTSIDSSDKNTHPVPIAANELQMHDATSIAQAGGAEPFITNDTIHTPLEDSALSTVTASKISPPPEPPIESPALQTPLLAPDGRETIVIAAPSGDTPQAALLPHDEEDQVPTIAHLKSYQARLQTKSQNRRLLSYAEEEALANAQTRNLDSSTPINIKINLPDQQKIIGKFTATEDGTTLYNYVKSCIVVTTEPFNLTYTTPTGPYTLPTSKRLIENPGFSRNMAVNLSWASDEFAKTYKGKVLREEMAVQAQKPEIKEVAAVEMEVPKPSTAPQPTKSGDKGGSGKGVPKWLKLKK